MNLMLKTLFFIIALGIAIPLVPFILLTVITLIGELVN